MKLSELMAGKTVDANYEGLLTVDDFVLAIDTTPGASPATTVANYAVLQKGVTGTPANVNPEEQTKQFIRGGKQTVVTSKQFTVSVSGTRYVGDEAQDYIMSFEKLFGTGSDLITNYVYFNIRTGKGWKGTCVISVSSIADGSAGDDAGFSCDLKQTESNPTEYTYS